MSRLASGIKRPVGKHMDQLSCTLSRGNPCHIMTERFHEFDRRVIVGILEADLIRNELIMKTRLSESLRGAQLLVDRVNDVLNSGCDNTTSSRRACDQKKLSIRVGDNCRGN